MKKVAIIIFINLFLIALPISVIYNKPEFLPVFDRREEMLRDTFNKSKSFESVSSYTNIILQRVSQFKPFWFKGNKIIIYFGIYWLLLNGFLIIALERKKKDNKK